MTATLIGYKKCTTCKKIEKLLKEKNIDYIYREIDKENPQKEEIKKWHEKTILPIKRFFNTSGIIYKEKGLAKNLETYSLEEKYELLAKDGKLVKRPILIIDEEIYVGADVKKYLENL